MKVELSSALSRSCSMHEHTDLITIDAVGKVQQVSTFLVTAFQPLWRALLLLRPVMRSHLSRSAARAENRRSPGSWDRLGRDNAVSTTLASSSPKRLKTASCMKAACSSLAAPSPPATAVWNAVSSSLSACKQYGQAQQGSALKLLYLQTAMWKLIIAVRFCQDSSCM